MHPANAPLCGRRRSGYAALAALGLALAAAPGGIAAEARVPSAWSLGQPAHRVFLESESLPHATVHALLLASDGRLWAGTQDGAAVYDGADWRVVDLPTRRLSNFVRDIAETADGALWFATQSAGLARLERGLWRVFDSRTGELPDDRINVLRTVEGEAGQELWIGTHGGGIARYRAGAFEWLGAERGLTSNRVWDLLWRQGEAGGELWVASGAGVLRWSAAGNRFERPEGAPEISSSSLLARVSDGVAEIWAGTYGSGVARLRDGRWEWRNADAGLENLYVTDLAPTADPESFWIATDGGGVVRYGPDGGERLELGAALSSGAVYRVLETTPEEGARAVWLGTRNHGLIRIADRHWRSFAPVAENPRLAVTALLFEPAGEGEEPALWLGTDGRGALRWARGAWTRHDVASGALGHDSVLAFAALEWGAGRREVWAGTRNGGIARWDGRRWQRFDRPGGLPGSELVQALLASRSQQGRTRLWAGTRAGLASWDGSRWRMVDGDRGAPQGSVVALAETPTGEGGGWELWVGTTQGLFREREGLWRRYAEAEGLRNPTVQALHASRDAAGRPVLWLGTDGGGAYRLDLDDPEARPLPLAELADTPPASDVVYAFAEDLRGRLFVSTNRGIVRLTPAGRRFVLESYGVHHGLPSGQGNRGAAAVDAGGRVWFGTVRGAAAFDPSTESVDRSEKRLLLEGALLGGALRPLRTGDRIGPGPVRIRFEYRLLSFFGEELTRYRTRLDGLEGAFGDWTARPEREVSALPPGSYRFEVLGRDSAGNTSGPVALDFEVAPALWQTGWARWAALLFALAGLAGIWRARDAATKRREQALQTLVAARTRQLENANALLLDLSYLDPVTSIPNRRRFDELLSEEWRRAVRAGTRLALLMVDVDAFKAFNDSYGHQRGDDCLRQVAATLSDGLSRAGDSVARYGGEEFAILLPGTDAAGAFLLAERLRRQIAGLAIPHRASAVAPHLTVSCGIAVRSPSAGEDPGLLVAAADGALYAAKNGGRNRTAMAD